MTSSDCKDCGQKVCDKGTPDGLCGYCDDDRRYGVGDQRCSKCLCPWRQRRCINECVTQGDNNDSVLQ